MSRSCPDSNTIDIIFCKVMVHLKRVRLKMPFALQQFIIITIIIIIEIITIINCCNEFIIIIIIMVIIYYYYSHTDCDSFAKKIVYIRFLT